MAIRDTLSGSNGNLKSNRSWVQPLFALHLHRGSRAQCLISYQISRSGSR
ncbi:hypothetical protein ACAX43_01645 [Paraburkholderia sp. IW21]